MQLASAPQPDPFLVTWAPQPLGSARKTSYVSRFSLYRSCPLLSYPFVPLEATLILEPDNRGSINLHVRLRGVRDRTRNLGPSTLGDTVEGKN
eukprot:2334516-Pyramimonas_sp.AAC.1